MKTFAIISLGCSRNLVDSEVVAGMLKAHGLKRGGLREGVDVCVVNTCAFIAPAREESIDSIMEVAELKREGRVKRLVVCGCLPQLYKEKLFKELPEADLVLGAGDFAKLPGFLAGIGKGKRYSDISAMPSYLYDETSPRFSLTPKHYAYVKVSEGCGNLCSYCIISRLRGQFRSRGVNSVVNEVRGLSKGGALKEVNLIGQDTTLFGKDRYGAPALHGLLKTLCSFETSVEWIRILYTHPAHYTDVLIETMRDEGKICKYLDLPIQHISDRILKRMNRRVTKREIVALIEKLRKRIPGLILRTSVIVGFPGETERDFKELLGFLDETKFEHLGSFVYSRENGTPAARFDGQVPEALKQERLGAVMKLQQQISRRRNRRYLGKTVRVLIDGREEGSRDLFAGRTQGDAPEVDGTVSVTGRGLKAGIFCDVRVTDTLEYDLVGERV